MHINSILTNVQSRAARWLNKDYMVVPVVMVVEGVHDGSVGPLLYPSEELSATAEQWEGVPVTVQHPKDEEGKFIMAVNAPEFIIGHISSPIWDDKLRAEAWIDVEKANLINTDIMAIIRGNGQLEVSTGLLSNDEMTKGDWKGETYAAIIRDITPDHLALLPGEKGACSWSDGCGIRANKGGGEVKFKNFDLKDFDLKDIPKSVLHAFLRNQLGEEVKWEGEFKTNEISHGDIRRQVQSNIDENDNQSQYHFVRDVFDKYFVYSREQDGQKTQFFKQGYNLAANDEVELVGDVVEVIQKTEYIKVNIDKEGKKMSEKGKKCCPEKVATLIANEKSSYIDDDKEWLEAMEEGQLDRLIANVGISKDAEKTLVTAAVKKAFDDAIKSGDIIKKEDVQKKEKAKTVDDYIANAPSEMQDLLKSSLAIHKDRKAGLVQQILTNELNSFAQKDLEAKTIDELTNIAALIPRKKEEGDSSYIANIGAGAHGESKEEPMEMPGIEVKK